MPFESGVLGRTGLAVGRLGVGASYGVPASAIERAFEQGVNYLYWGTFRRGGFKEGLRNLSPKRERIVLVMQSYSRMASLLGWSVERGLRAVRFDCVDVLLLGLWNKPVPRRILDAGRALQARGLVKFLGVSSHRRVLVPEFATGKDFDVVHFRYNAAHPGAEVDIFPKLPSVNRAGLVSFTATSWGQLLKPQVGERVPTATDCYRFVLSRPEVDVCLSGPSNAAQMDEALRALELGPMTEDELAWMRRVGAAASGKIVPSTAVGHA